MSKSWRNSRYLRGKQDSSGGEIFSLKLSLDHGPKRAGNNHQRKKELPPGEYNIQVDKVRKVRNKPVFRITAHIVED